MSDGSVEATTHIFTPAEQRQVREAFQGALGNSLRRGERFSVSGTLVEGRLEVVIELADPDRTDVATFTAGYEVGGAEDPTPVEARAHAVEFLHTVISDYLQSDRFPRPHIDWREYDFEGHRVFFRGSVVNEVLEREADALLGELVDDT